MKKKINHQLLREFFQNGPAQTKENTRGRRRDVVAYSVNKPVTWGLMQSFV